MRAGGDGDDDDSRKRTAKEDETRRIWLSGESLIRPTATPTKAQVWALSFGSDTTSLQTSHNLLCIRPEMYGLTTASR